MSTKKNTGPPPLPKRAKPQAGAPAPPNTVVQERPAGLSGLDEPSTAIMNPASGLTVELRVENGKHRGEWVKLGEGTALLGRSSSCAIVLNRSAGASRRHARVFYAQGAFFLEDLESRNGTRLNGVRVSGHARLHDGDLISINEEQIRFSAVDPAAQTAPQAHGAQATAAAPRLISGVDHDGPSDAPPPLPPEHERTAGVHAQVASAPAAAVLPPPTRGAGGAPPSQRPIAAQVATDPKKSFVVGIVLGLTIVLCAVGVYRLWIVSPEPAPSTAVSDAADTSVANRPPSTPDAPPLPSEDPRPRGSDLVSPTNRAGSSSPTPNPTEDAARPTRPATPNEAPPLVVVRAPVSGTIDDVGVRSGDRVEQDQRLVSISKKNANTERKLRALRREEASFSAYAESGNARAQQDLDQVRREIRRLESQSKTIEVRAPSGGVVSDVYVRETEVVRSGLLLLKIQPTPSADVVP